MSFTDTFQKAAQRKASDGSFIVPDPPVPLPESETESLDVWGFRDTHFDFSENGHVMIRGNRYELSGKELPRFLPWVCETLDVHGVGKLRRAYLPRIMSPTAVQWKRDLKKSLDPSNIFVAGNQDLDLQ